MWHAGHRVSFVMDKFSGFPAIEFTCDEPDGTKSWCRKVCSKDCEQWDEDHDTTHGHPWCWRTACNVLDWLENSEETYAGPDGVPAVSGPIEVEWSGDCFVWRIVPQEDLAEQVRILRETIREVVIELEATRTS